MLSSATKVAANVTKSLAENDIRNTARDTLRDVEDRGHDVLNDVSGYANEAGQKVRSLFDRTIDNSKNATSKIENEIKSNPIRSSAIALGAGFIIGALLTRR
ncbi:DUF883 family protein [Asticcacaulis benevestitus]|uniref:DUF883 domain-containing protein n=1 Tax=Asticcacaulis benevestitus DSM 16100 = ATCC BAA-896 TaxID=1121022 RepID=V4Q2W6_9CAUL|nr:hypothetical protein [Asticcacaulis benevestitus]ESQ94044.1 hypothetical protein ABENE_02850 [Asticcacaulis benevestitus DSM 16100 = ATCC BAA-896]